MGVAWVLDMDILIVGALTDQQIVDCANALARQFYAAQGYEVPEGYAFHKGEHPQEQLMWEFACMAFEAIADTDVENALVEINEERSERWALKRKRKRAVAKVVLDAE